ncbi:hypothetical protein WJX81_000183 [Elliptochloris bilobata]|uniref:Acid phosphatase/vanadium-dependent haloperoxidase-related protein n=1 Tax=Elliptochloris bilobata TaxID=381761 RepID=A0AAW1RNG8_9CHLO
MCSSHRSTASAPHGSISDLQDVLRRRVGRVLALSAVAVVTPTPTQAWADLCSNYVFRVGFLGWFTAQTAKIFTRRYKTGVWDLTACVDSGGMPSSHSSLCTAVTTAVAFQFGLGSALFAVALCFSLVVMYDAAGVRRHAGKQAEVLNVVLEDVLHAHPISEQRMKEVLGHTPLQVITGAILGVLMGCIVPIPATVIMG